MIPEKITFRPGNLAGAMGKKLDETGETPSVYVRRLIAEDCGRKPPAMDGHIKTLKRVNRDKRRESH
jgi:hypothetical protein